MSRREPPSFPIAPGLRPPPFVLRVHLVAHTHWDREWYHTQVRFRQRLVALVDELLDDPPPPGESFLLDGQAIVLEDYLAVRPERAAELSVLLQSGRLEAGPWYVLGDELIPSGEALVRDLIEGRRALRSLRAEPPPVLYCPDSFGHPAALPALARGFGIPLVILWRGFGGRRWPATDVFTWRAPNGDRALVYHLPRDGYEYGSRLPVEALAARERWRRMRAELSARASLPVVLVLNGADHHARQERQHEAVAVLAQAVSETSDHFVAGSLSGFAHDICAEAVRAQLPVVEGELRDSYGYTWTLQGTFATRAAQKRRNAQTERSLVRDAEPWAALARRAGARSRAPLLAAAWRTLLQAHPHDTLCGCSIDAVARAMDRRLGDAIEQAAGIREDSLADIVHHDPVAARAARDRWTPAVVVRNRAARSRGGVAYVDVFEFVADVPVGPGSAPMAASLAQEPTDAKRAPTLAEGSPLQVLDMRLAHDRIESPRHYPDNDLVRATRAAVWLDPVAGYGTTSIAIGGKRRRASTPRHPVRCTRDTLDNGLVRVTVSADGSASVAWPDSGRELDSLFRIEDRVDLGDLYTPSIRGAASRAEYLGMRLTHAGPLVAELRLRWLLLDESVAAAARPRARGTIALGLVIEAGSPFLRMRVDGRNRSNDHRLRLAVRTDVRRGEVWADAALGPVARHALHLPDEDRHMEAAPATAPLHRYVSLFGAESGVTLYSDGLAEYEATPDGEILVTLLRAVGQLSRNDLPERPGHAGWPAATPLAQSRGPFSARFALLAHAARDPEIIHQIERAADDVLLPLVGSTIRDSVGLPAPTRGAELSGDGLAFSALKAVESGDGVMARCVNLLDEPVDGRWSFGFPVREAFTARLDETLREPLTVEGGVVPFQAPARGVVTIIVR